MSYLCNIPVNYLVDLNIWRTVSIIHNCKNIKINVWTSVTLQSKRHYKHNFFLLSIYTGGFMDLCDVYHCQITKSKDFLFTNGDEGFAFFEPTTHTTLD